MFVLFCIHFLSFSDPYLAAPPEAGFGLSKPQTMASYIYYTVRSAYTHQSHNIYIYIILYYRTQIPRQIHRFLCVLEKWSSRINPTQKIKHSEFRSIHNFQSVANTRATRFLMDLHAGVPLAACKLQLSFQLLGSFFEVPSPLGLLDNPAEKSQHEHAT